MEFSQEFIENSIVLKAFIPGPSDFVPHDDNPAPSSRGSKASSSPQNDPIGVKSSEAATQNKRGSIPGWQWILGIIIIIYILSKLIMFLA